MDPLQHTGSSGGVLQAPMQIVGGGRGPERTLGETTQERITECKRYYMKDAVCKGRDPIAADYGLLCLESERERVVQIWVSAVLEL